MSLYELLSDTSLMSPSKLAVTCGDVRLTYAQLKERVDRLASGLKSLEVGKGDRLAVIHRNCHMYMDVYFACAKLGAIIVPINCRLAPDDFIHILKDSDSKVLIGEHDLIGCLPDRMGELPELENVVLTKRADEGLAGDRAHDYSELLNAPPLLDEDAPRVEGSDIAQLYYTSGTTGRPKGVILTHANNLAHSRSAIKELGLTSADRWLHVSPMFHLADAWAVWSITEAGGVHVVIPAFEPGTVLDTIWDHRVTLSNFIPTMLNVLVKHPDVGNYTFDSLRLLLSGGAPIAKEVVRSVIETFGCDYVQTYGLTETSPFLTVSILEDWMKELPFEDRLKHMVTTGRPFHGVELKVMRRDGEEITRGGEEVGEVMVRGATITPGYWNDPGTTSERIVEGWLHTRDLAVVNEHGYITIVDRMEDMIITGGENVYSVEVEDVLYSHPGIYEAAVLGLSDEKWGEMVAAVVVPREGTVPTQEEIITFCREKLAPFKCPKRVFFTDELPKTGSAKVCKYELKERYAGV